MGAGASAVAGENAANATAAVTGATIEAQELDEADKALISSSRFSSEDQSLLANMTGYLVTTTVGSVEVKVPVRCILAAGGEGKVALCLHGLGEDRCMGLWSGFWPSLLSKGFHIAAVDFPGFGRSKGGETDPKVWRDADADFLLKIIAALQAPAGSVSVFGEGIGGCAFLRAFAKDPAPFAAHHILFNVQIGQIPSEFVTNLESTGTDVLALCCEKLHAEQEHPWLASGMAVLTGMLCDPSTMGRLGNMIIWKVKGVGEAGCSPFHSMKDGDWCRGGLEKIDKLARRPKFVHFSPSEECIGELLGYLLSPRRKVHSAIGSDLPEKSAIEMGEINENFQVFIRVRPLLEREIKVGAKNCFAISDTDFPRDPPPQRIVVQEGGDVSVKGSFVFNRVFEDSYGQDQVYAATAKPYVADFLAGTNVTIFAYGQTGTGKTYTIAGPKDNPGIISRCLTDVFAGLAGKELHFEYVQLYMDDFKDLLIPEPKSELKLYEGKSGGVYVQNLTTRKADSVDQILKALDEGAARRATRSQDMNEVSSRSHAILMLRLKDAGTDDAEPFSSMFIVDLAGSERVARSGVTGQGFDEATSINQSLTSLGRVVVTLIDAETNRKTFIPYNASPLTMVLKGGLGGNSKTALIACVTQAADSMSESVSTLRFAMQASHVKNKVAKTDEQNKQNEEKAKIADAGNTVTLSDGKGVVPLSVGEIEVHGNVDGSPDKQVILLADLTADPAALGELIGALASRGCQVLAPKLPGTTERGVADDAAVLLELLDWLGWARPVIYGRDWGAMRAVKFKICSSGRASTLVLENRKNKQDEAGYKAACKKDPSYALNEYMGPFLWIFDSTFPKDLNGKPGTNFNGFKGKVVLLWPFHFKGKHDATKKSASAKIAQMYARVFKTQAVDSFPMSEDDLGEKIAGCFSAASAPSSSSAR